jgi:hypothetical protein
VSGLQPFDELQKLLGAADGERPNPPAANSRYRFTPVAEGTDAAGRKIVYLRRRFVPPPEASGTIREVLVRQGDRLDNLAAEHLGDPELFWRLCDASRTLEPEELEKAGTRLRVPPPDGVPVPATNV